MVIEVAFTHCNSLAQCARAAATSPSSSVAEGDDDLVVLELENVCEAAPTSTVRTYLCHRGCGLELNCFHEPRRHLVQRPNAVTNGRSMIEKVRCRPS